MTATDYFTITMRCPQCRSEGRESYLALRQRGIDGRKSLDCCRAGCPFECVYDPDVHRDAMRAAMGANAYQAATRIQGLEDTIALLQQRIVELEWERRQGGYRDHFWGEPAQPSGATFRDGRRTVDLADELRKLMGQFHPDKNQGGIDPTKVTQEIGRLYNIVKRSGT